MYLFIFLVKFGLLSGRLLGNSCSLGLRYVFLVFSSSSSSSSSSSKSAWPSLKHLRTVVIYVQGRREVWSTKSSLKTG